MANVFDEFDEPSTESGSYDNVFDEFDGEQERPPKPTPESVWDEIAEMWVDPPMAEKEPEPVWDYNKGQYISGEPAQETFGTQQEDEASPFIEERERPTERVAPSSFEKAVEIIIASLEPFGKEYTKTLRQRAEG